MMSSHLEMSVTSHRRSTRLFLDLHLVVSSGDMLFRPETHRYSFGHMEPNLRTSNRTGPHQRSRVRASGVIQFDSLSAAVGVLRWQLQYCRKPVACEYHYTQHHNIELVQYCKNVYTQIRARSSARFCGRAQVLREMAWRSGAPVEPFASLTSSLRNTS